MKGFDQMAAKKYFAAKALVNITHNLKSYKIGETLKLTVDESKEFEDNGYVEMIDTLPTEPDPNDGEGKGEGEGDPNGKDGE
jgi:hypothetical protein